MYLRHKNKVIHVLLRPKFTAIIVLWFLAGSIFYYWWYISNIMVLESQPSPVAFKKSMTEEKPLCETIHLAMVCMNKCTQNITPMFKSLLYHRQNPLHFHILVDKQTRDTLNTLFKTWELPDVTHSTYLTDLYIDSITWIPNSHYSGVFAMIKLLFPEILPFSLYRVVVLDSDLTFRSDVAKLWSQFKEMNEKQFIGLVENESDWYLNKEKVRWPALGRGYNTGVMLLDLKKMREKDWHTLWDKTVRKYIEKYSETTLADQDIINAVIIDHPHIVYNVSCMYNIQMSVKNVAQSCYDSDFRKVKIIHWNSPFKQSVKTNSSDYFKNIHQMFVNLDGNLLKTKLHYCYKNENQSPRVDLNTKNLCARISAASRLTLRTHIFFMEHVYLPLGRDDFDVTLVLHLSFDRLTFLERLARFWEGPISAAIYLSDCDVTSLHVAVNVESEVFRNRRNIGYHLVYKQDLIHYPVNYLRNVALEHAVTPYVFLIDVDFVPMNNLYQHLKAAIRVINPYPQKKVLVVPAFETQRYRVNPPANKTVLLSQLTRPGGDVAPFRSREWPAGHRATDYVAWTKATKPYEVEWQPNYEPYLVVHRSVPRFDNRFSGFGWNKVAHSYELRAQGYRPVVLPDAFVVHTPHAPSTDIVAFRNDNEYRVCLFLLKDEFMKDLKAKYNVSFTDETLEKELDSVH